VNGHEHLRRGFGIVAVNVMRDPEIPGPAKALYAVLATYADSRGECHPSHETLARDLGAVEKSVRNWMQALVEAGVIERHRQYEGGREVTSSTVLLDLRAWHRSQPVTSSGGMEPSFPDRRNARSINQHQKNNTTPSELDGGEREGSTSSRRRPSLPFPEEGLTPSDRNREYAEQHGLDLRSELERFEAHALANDRRQANWQQAFRQWLGNAVQWRAERGQRANGWSSSRQQQSPDEDAFDDWLHYHPFSEPEELERLEREDPARYREERKRLVAEHYARGRQAVADGSWT
jgi:hypothetical protein